MKLPRDATLAVLLFEILAPDLAYRSDNAYGSRAEKGISRALEFPDTVRYSGTPGVWYVQSERRSSLWYEVNLSEPSCTDMRPYATYGCEDSQTRRAPLCWHQMAAATAEAGRRAAERERVGVRLRDYMKARTAARVPVEAGYRIADVWVEEPASDKVCRRCRETIGWCVCK